MTTDQVLIGVGLILLLAVGSQILAGRLHVPALIVLLPVGFAASALLDDVASQQIPYVEDAHTDFTVAEERARLTGEAIGEFVRIACSRLDK